MINLKDYIVYDLKGNLYDWSKTNNKLVLIVNTASKCGYAHQLLRLEELHNKYKDKGLVIIGFPSRQFLYQEFATNQEISTYCTNKQLSFDMMELTYILGKQIHPLFEKLINEHPWSHRAKAIKWNYEKFFIKDNQVIGRFKSDICPCALEEFIINNLK